MWSRTCWSFPTEIHVASHSACGKSGPTRVRKESIESSLTPTAGPRAKSRPDARRVFPSFRARRCRKQTSEECRESPQPSAFRPDHAERSAQWLRRPAAGFSLIEIAIVVVVLAIIAMIALPSYQRAMQKSRRAEGKAFLHTILAAQERHYTTTNRYTDDPTATGMPGSIESQPGRFYTIASMRISDEAQTVVVTVQPQGSQVGDPCGNLSLDSKGRRDADGQSASQTCW